jgi:hypothetical protein
MLGVLASAGMGIGKHAIKHPRIALGIGAGITALNGDLFNTFATGRASSGNTNPNSAYFTAPSDVLKKSMQLYGENPVTSFALGIGANALLSKYSGIDALRNIISKNAVNGNINLVTGLPNSSHLPGMVKDMRFDGLLGKFSKLENKKSWKDMFSLINKEGKASISATKFIKRHGLGDTAVGQKLLSRIQTVDKIKKVTNFATWAWATQAAYDLGKSLFSGSTPPSNISPIRTTSLGGTFNDSSEAYTQRRRAIEAMHNSQFSGRSAFGNEASLMHA